MKIEILYPEFCNLFGDMGNMKYLKQCIPDAEFTETAYHDTPLFVKGEADMIYMGPCTDQAPPVPFQRSSGWTRLPDARAEGIRGRGPRNRVSEGPGCPPL